MMSDYQPRPDPGVRWSRFVRRSRVNRCHLSVMPLHLAESRHVLNLPDQYAKPGQWCPIANRDAIPALPAAGWFGACLDVVRWESDRFTRGIPSSPGAPSEHPSREACRRITPFECHQVSRTFGEEGQSYLQESPETVFLAVYRRPVLWKHSDTSPIHFSPPRLAKTCGPRCATLARSR